MPNLPASPERNSVLSQRPGLFSNEWLRWIRLLVAAVNSAPGQLGRVLLMAQQAAIALTSIPTSELNDGLYRISWYLQITQAATTSSSVTITVGWTARGVAQSFTAAAVTGNTLTTYQPGDLFVRVDEGTAITYSTAYASVGATPMQYSLDVAVEQVANV